VRRKRPLPILIVALVVIALIVYWLTRPETFRAPTEATSAVQQIIPANLPTGHTAFLDVPAGDLNRLEMFYRVAGDPQNTPVLLIHGIAGDSGTTWYNTYAGFAENYYVIAPDLRGHGLTMQPPGDTSIEQMAEDVFALIDSLGIAQAHVVGHSMGGLVAMQFTNAHADRVRTLTLIDTAATWNQGIIGVGLPLYPYWVRIENRTVGWQQENRSRASAFTRYEVAPEYHEWAYQRRQFNQTEPFIAAWEAISRFSAVEFLPTISQPAMIIYGEDDDLVPPELREQLFDLLPQAERLILPSPARHYPHIQYADVVNPALNEFFAAHS
jgi:pimeloyl-ACP methyl ester carboxylesterase